MTVQELIQQLEQMDPDAEVRIMTQSSWPFENAIHGVAARADWVEEAEPCYAYLNSPNGCEDIDCQQSHSEPQDLGPDQPLDTVFIVEGQQICYGSKEAWR